MFRDIFGTSAPVFMSCGSAIERHEHIGKERKREPVTFCGDSDICVHFPAIDGFAFNDNYAFEWYAIVTFSSNINQNKLSETNIVVR